MVFISEHFEAFFTGQVMLLWLTDKHFSGFTVTFPFKTITS